MQSPMIRCIYCASEIRPDGGRAKCSACDGTFDFTPVARDAREPLSYVTPAIHVKPPLELSAVAALLLSLVSCAFPLIAAGGVALGIIAVYRVGLLKRRGKDTAVAAIILSLIGTAAYYTVLPQLRDTERPGVRLAQCQSHLRQIGGACMLYEQDYPLATGYTLMDLGSFVGKEVLTCPAEELIKDTRIAGGKDTSYVLLSHLRPFHRLEDAAGTIVAFERVGHRAPLREGEQPQDVLAVLYGDGHTEALPLKQALSAISASMRTKHRAGPASQPIGR